MNTFLSLNYTHTLSLSHHLLSRRSWILHSADDSYNDAATAARTAARRAFCKDEPCRLLQLDHYSINIYPDKEIHFIPTLLSYFEPHSHNSQSMLFDSARIDSKLVDVNPYLYTRPHAYFYYLFSAELELFLKPEPNPGTSFAHQREGVTFRKNIGKTRLVTDYNEKFMGW